MTTRPEECILDRHATDRSRARWGLSVPMTASPVLVTNWPAGSALLVTCPTSCIERSTCESRSTNVRPRPSGPDDSRDRALARISRLLRGVVSSRWVLSDGVQPDSAIVDRCRRSAKSPRSCGTRVRSGVGRDLCPCSSMLVATTMTEASAAAPKTYDRRGATLECPTRGRESMGARRPC
jgi:hypothetical protein